VEVELHEFLTSAVDAGEWPASRPRRFTPRGRAFWAQCIRGWVGPKADLDAVAKKKSSLSLPGIEPRASSP